MLTSYLPPKAVRAAGQLQPTPNIVSLKDNLGMFRKKGEKAALFLLLLNPLAVNTRQGVI